MTFAKWPRPSMGCARFSFVPCNLPVRSPSGPEGERTQILAHGGREVRLDEGRPVKRYLDPARPAPLAELPVLLGDHQEFPYGESRQFGELLRLGEEGVVHFELGRLLQLRPQARLDEPERPSVQHEGVGEAVFDAHRPPLRPGERPPARLPGQLPQAHVEHDPLGAGEPPGQPIRQEAHLPRLPGLLLGHLPGSPGCWGWSKYFRPIPSNGTCCQALFSARLPPTAPPRWGAGGTHSRAGKTPPPPHSQPPS